MEKSFREHSKDLHEDLPAYGSISMDGKVLRGSFDHFEDRKAAQVVSALAAQSNLVLGHIWITDEDGEKQHEIQAVQRLIKELGGVGQLFTMDALHTQKTTETVIESNNDLLVQLKRNQPSLHDAMVEHAQKQSPDDTNRMHDQGKRNRIETRDASTWSLSLENATESWHSHFKTLVCIHRVVDRFDTRKKNWRTTRETAYYLCTREIEAKEANQVVRNHWGVENRIHHVRDTCMDEDASRIRNNPSIFGLLRSFALN